MKQYLLIFLAISVTAAYRVINVNSESEPRLHKSGIESKDPKDFRRNSPGRNPDPEASKVDDGLNPENPQSSIFVSTPPINSMFEWLQNSMRMMMYGVMSPFRTYFPSVFRSKPKTKETPVVETGSPDHVIPGVLDSVFFDDSEMGDHLKIPSVHKFPPNYSNSTSEVHDSKEAKLIVNQTINKKSGDGFSKFFVVKSFHLIPKNESLDKDQEKEVTIETDTAKDESTPDTRLNEVEIDDKITPQYKEEQGGEPGESVVESETQNNDRVRRFRREIRDQIVRSASDTGLKGIEFPPSNLDRFPQSFLNNRNIRVEDLKNSLGGSISKSYVYKNIGGKTIMYIVDHKPKTKVAHVVAVGNDIGAVRPPDLSRDTKVNPSGNDDHQQSLVLVDPEAEVFDLNLVAKEIESRPKDK